MENAYIFRTILGNIKIEESNDFITNIQFMNEKDVITDSKETSLVIQAATQLEEYLSGSRKQFDLPLKLIGTEFQKNVWHILQTIPYGERWSYKQVAIALGKPTAARAVGMANNKNPIPIIVPCHRVIGANGDLVGYGGGLVIKARLLQLEKENYEYSII